MLWSRIEPHIPKSLFGRECVGLHPLMRLMRYEEAGSLSAHVDGTLELGTGASLEGLSFLTGMFYLNHDFSGGATRFFRSYDYCDQTHSYDGEGVIDIAPRAGMLNIFQHDLVHMGLPVSGTRKYGIRVMVCYKLKADEGVDDARLTHIWYPD